MSCDSSASILVQSHQLSASSANLHHISTESWTLGTRCIFLFHFERLPFPEAAIYFRLVEMARDSRLFEWYSVLEDQCFVDRLHQAVRTFLFPFYFMKFGKSGISQVANHFP